jgi:excisionase family DNA binding protein
MTTPLVVDKSLYTPVEAAHALGVSRSTLYVLMANGHLSSVRIGSSRPMVCGTTSSSWALRRQSASLRPMAGTTGTAAPLEVTVPAQL